MVQQFRMRDKSKEIQDKAFTTRMVKPENFDQLKVKRVRLADKLKEEKRKKRLQNQQWLSKHGTSTHRASSVIEPKNFNKTQFGSIVADAKVTRNNKMHFKGATSLFLQQEASMRVLDLD